MNTTGYALLSSRNSALVAIVSSFLYHFLLPRLSFLPEPSSNSPYGMQLHRHLWLFLPRTSFQDLWLVRYYYLLGKVLEKLSLLNSPVRDVSAQVTIPCMQWSAGGRIGAAQPLGR